jgi:hypothetical protein
MPTRIVRRLCARSTRGRRIWRGARRSPFLRRVQVEIYVVFRLTKDNKEEDFVDVAPGWG